MGSGDENGCQRLPPRALVAFAALFQIIPAFELVVVGSDSAAAVVSRSPPSSACLHLRKSLVEWPVFFN